MQDEQTGVETSTPEKPKETSDDHANHKEKVEGCEYC